MKVARSDLQIATTITTTPHQEEALLVEEVPLEVQVVVRSHLLRNQAVPLEVLAEAGQVILEAAEEVEAAISLSTQTLTGTLRHPLQIQ
jgi:hypothetical protein